MPNPNPLDALTPERMREMAARLKGAIGFLSVHGYNDEYLKNFVDAATLCEAVAKAQEAILADPAAQICLYDDDGSGAIGVEKNVGIFQEWSTACPTLAAALGAVGGDYANPSK